MKRLAQTLAALSLAGFVAATALAEPPPPKDPGAQDPTAQRQPPGPNGTYLGLRASTMIGSKVKNDSGKDLGTIVDLAADPANGRVVYAVLSFGGFLGMGDKYFAIPIQSLDFNHDGYVQFDVEKSTLEEAQGFDKNNWPDMANEQWATETHTRYGQKPYWDEQGQPTGQTDTSRPQRIIKMSEAVGANVKSTDDKDVGEIEDVMIDASQSRIAFAVLDCGKFLEEKGRQLVPVPWGKLSADDVKNIRLTVDKSTLSAAPRIKPDDWPKRDDSNLLVQVYAHYEVRPYWQRGYSSTGGGM